MNRSLSGRMLFVVGFFGLISCAGPKTSVQKIVSEKAADNGGLGRVMKVSIGGQHACALHASGQVSCWGQNSFGQLGDGSTTDRFWAAAVEGLDDATQVSAGIAHACALRANGQVVCWGSKLNGALGEGGIWNSLRSNPVAVVPVPVSGVGGMRTGQNGELVSICGAFTHLSDIVHIDVDSRKTCVVHQSGAVACWGSNITDARVKDFSHSMDEMLAPCPLPVYGDVQDVVQVFVEDSASPSCALRKDGSVVCWTTEWRSRGDRVNPALLHKPYLDIQLPQGSTFLNRLALKHHCVVDEDGLMDCADARKAARVDEKTLSPFDGFWCAATLEGRVACSAEAAQALSLSDVQEGLAFVPGIETATRVSSGGFSRLYLRNESVLKQPDYQGDSMLTQGPFACAVLENGGVTCWGNNDHGQLGRALETDVAGQSNGAVLVLFEKPDDVTHNPVNAYASAKDTPLTPFERQIRGLDGGVHHGSKDCPVSLEFGSESASNVLRLQAWGKERSFRIEEVLAREKVGGMEIVVPSTRELNTTGVGDGWEQLKFNVLLRGEPKVGDQLPVVLETAGFPLQLGCFLNPLTLQGTLHIKQVQVPKRGGRGYLGGTIELFAGTKDFGAVTLNFEKIPWL